MTTFLLLVIIAGLILGVWWNHRSAGIVLAGRSFILPYPPSVVADALDRIHHKGTKAAFQNMLSGLDVTAIGPSSFAIRSNTGDTGEISLSRDPAGTLVQVRALSLWHGMPQKQLDSANGGIWGLSVAISHGLVRLLGVAPGAARLKRWQAGLEGRLGAALAKPVVH